MKLAVGLLAMCFAQDAAQSVDEVETAVDAVEDVGIDRASYRPGGGG